MSRQCFNIPAPEALERVGECELVAILCTMDFPTPDNAMSVASGDGIAGKRGYWRFLPGAPGGRYSLKRVLANGTDARQAEREGAYPEQAYMAACMHNYRMLVEQVRAGLALRARRCGYLWLLEPAGGESMRWEQTAQEWAVARELGTENVAMVAGLVTLGFDVEASGGRAVDHGKKMCRWRVSERSADGKWGLSEVMTKWGDEEWCGEPGNVSPVAAMADCMWNLRYLRDSLAGAVHYIRAANGGRSVVVRKDASEAVWEQAEKFLLRV